MLQELKSTKMFKKTSEKSHIKMIKQKYAKKMRSESKRSKSRYVNGYSFSFFCSGSYDDLAAQIMVRCSTTTTSTSGKSQETSRRFFKPNR